MKVQPQKEHDWLRKLVGEWTWESDCIMGPDRPPEKSSGTATVRSLGSVWILCEGRSEMPGDGTETTLIMLGYDPAKKRFVGTFIASMMSHLWTYDGSLDTTGKVLTVDTEGPNVIAPGKMAEYKDVIEVKSDDHWVLTSRVLGDDGNWRQFMTAHYRRKK